MKPEQQYHEHHHAVVAQWVAFVDVHVAAVGHRLEGIVAAGGLELCMLGVRVSVFD